MQQPVGHLPHPRRPGAAGRVLRADDARRRTPMTVTVGYQVDLGRNMSFEVDLHQPPDARHPRGLRPRALRDGHRAARPPAIRARSIDPQSLWLGLDYFGYTQNPGSNFVIATLNGGKRNYQGVDLVFRKRYSNNWQLLGSYTYNWAKGNTNSDSNADFQGDVLCLDPLAPNYLRAAAGHDPARLQGGRLVHLADRHRARRGVPLQLRHDRQPDVPRTRAATCRSGR